MAPKTRALTACPVFGTPCELSDCVLPSYRDVMRHYLLLRNTEVGGCASNSEVIRKITERLETIWQKASIPVTTSKSIVDRIITYHKKYRTLMKPYKSQRGKSATYDKKFDMFVGDSLKLFDIATCKCVTSGCTCPRDHKVPQDERAFLVDQRTERKMMIGGIDAKQTNVLHKREERKRKRTHSEVAADCNSLDLSSSTEDVPPVPTSDKDYVPTTPSAPKSESLIKLDRFLLECDRSAVSDRTGARLASAYAQDLGLIDSSSSPHVVDRSKIRRQRKKMRTTLCAKKDEFLVRSIYFDGRKDQTRQGSKFVCEEHVTILSEPNSRYLGHISPVSGAARHISDGIMQFMRENNVDTSSVAIVGCDGTSVNTGPKGGVIRLLEEALDRPMQWFVCLLHMNELPLRHLIRHVDGVTQGPSGFSGPIGKLLKTCENKSVVSFKRIPIQLPKMDSDLSCDQKYLYEICLAVNSGYCDPSLAARTPGKMCHSRWLTTANRILRLYVSTEVPDEKLCCLVMYIVKVYAPVWFAIKRSPSCINGPRHYHDLIKRSRYLPDSLKAIVDPVIKRNGYFAHSENLVLAMIGDPRASVRKSAVDYIASSRSQVCDGVRTFAVPNINLDADDYTSLIDLGVGPCLEPPLTQQYSLPELTAFVTDPDPYVRMTKYPCHTQAVERSIKLVTEAAAAVSGPETREGFIRSTLKSRNIMPVFETKRDFAV